MAGGMGSTTPRRRHGPEAGPARTPAGSGGPSPQPPAAPSAWWRPAWVAATVTLALAAAVVGWWTLGSRGDGGRLTPAQGSRPPLNLVIITLDTTRADHVGAYGSREVETPVSRRLAREGVLFEQAMTTAPLTLPAHASILTGRFPPEHGVRDNGGFYLGPDQTTLAEILGPQGFKTGGFVAAYVLDAKWGIGQGFETYFDDFDMSKSRGGPSARFSVRPTKS